MNLSKDRASERKQKMRILDLDFVNKMEEMKNEGKSLDSILSQNYDAKKIGSVMYWMLKNRQISGQDFTQFLEISNLNSVSSLKAEELNLFSQMFRKLKFDQFVSICENLFEQNFDLSFIEIDHLFTPFDPEVINYSKLNENDMQYMISKLHNSIQILEYIFQSSKTSTIIHQNEKSQLLCFEVIKYLSKSKQNFYSLRSEIDDCITHFYHVIIQNKMTTILEKGIDRIFEEESIHRVFLNRYSQIDEYNNVVKTSQIGVKQLTELMKIVKEKIKYREEDIYSILANGSEGINYELDEVELINFIEWLGDQSEGVGENFAAVLASNSSNFGALAYLKENYGDSLGETGLSALYSGLIEMVDLTSSANLKESEAWKASQSLLDEASGKVSPALQIELELKVNSLKPSAEEFVSRSEELIKSSVLNSIRNRMTYVLGKVIRSHQRDFEKDKAAESLRILLNRTLSDEDLIELYNGHLTMEKKWEAEEKTAKKDVVFMSELFHERVGRYLRKRYALEYDQMLLDQKAAESEEGEQIKKLPHISKLVNLNNIKSVNTFNGRKGIKFNIHYYQELFFHRPFFLDIRDITNQNVDKIMTYFYLNQ
jgi:hypothetical protein